MFSERTKKIVSIARAQNSESNESDSSNFDFDSDDSVRDKNYEPSDFSGEEQFTETDCEELTDNELEVNQDRQNVLPSEWQKVNASNELLFPIFNSIDKCNIPESALTPLDFFKLLITDEVIDIIVEETNRYASQIDI